MTLAELLSDEAIAFLTELPDLEAVLNDLLARLGERAGHEADEARKLARDLSFGSRGEVVRLTDDVAVVLDRVEDLREPVVALALSARSFDMSGEGPEPRGQARAILLVLSPHSPARLRDRFVPAVGKALRDEQLATRLLEARSPGEVRALEDLMDIVLDDQPLVEDALTPLRYRIYPDTPLEEVLDLMIRRELLTLPVVGESLEVLGIISVGDVLRHVLPGGAAGEGAEGAGEGELQPEALARDVMTRTVMCVAEDQSLQEVARLMVNRDVDQLPVVREGEFVGFLTRHAILSRLFG